MALTNSYATVAELRNHFADAGSALSLELLERALNASSRAVDHHCGRRFWADAATTTRTFDGTGRDVVYVDDISTRTGVVVTSGTDGSTFGTSWTVGTEYILEPRNADAAGATSDAYAFWRLRALGGRYWPDACYGPTVQVVAKFGWSAVPPEVNQATILKAAQLMKRKDAPFGVAGFGEFGAVRIGRNDPDVIDLLSEYRKPRVA